MTARQVVFALALSVGVAALVHPWWVAVPIAFASVWVWARLRSRWVKTLALLLASIYMFAIPGPAAQAFVPFEATKPGCVWYFHRFDVHSDGEAFAAIINIHQRVRVCENKNGWLTTFTLEDQSMEITAYGDLDGWKGNVAGAVRNTLSTDPARVYDFRNEAWVRRCVLHLGQVACQPTQHFRLFTRVISAAVNGEGTGGQPWLQFNAYCTDDACNGRAVATVPLTFEWAWEGNGAWNP